MSEKYKGERWWWYDSRGLCRILGVSRQTLYRWSKLVKYPGERWANNYGKPVYDHVSKAVLIKWLDAVELKLPNYNIRLKDIIDELKADS